MAKNPDETTQLLESAKCGNETAFEDLFNRHRSRLRNAIALRMDRRVAARVDASDVIQETYLEAYKRLPKYLEKEQMPFYFWLHWIAREKVIGLHRRHLGAEKRTIRHEVPLMPADNSATFVSGITGRMPSPSQEFAKKELAEKLQIALGQLTNEERDLILWRHFEQLSTRDIALMLNITEAAASKRYIRAVDRLRKFLQKLEV